VVWGGCRDQADCGWKPLLQLKHCGESPPAEVAADPERLALWKAREAKVWADYDSEFTPIVEVSGCGKRVWYAWAWRYGWRRGDRYPKLIVLKSAEIPR
jgi:hypothetical protein